MHFFFCVNIVAPTVDGLFHNREQFTSFFFPEGEDTIPFSDIETFQEYIDSFLDNLESLVSDSFIDLIFSDKVNPYNIVVNWNNGTSTNHIYIEGSTSFFQHISSMTIETTFSSFSRTTDVIGCTKWNISVTVLRSTGTYVFETKPKFHYDSCEKGFIRGMSTEKTTISRRRSSKVSSINGFYRRNVLYAPSKERFDNRLIQQIKYSIETDALDDYVPPLDAKTDSSFYLYQLTLYTPMIRYGLIFLIISLVSLVSDVTNIKEMFEQHRFLLVNSGEYKEKRSFDQFHETIGLWNSLFFLRSMFMLITSISILRASSSLTQYINFDTMKIFGFSSLLSISCCLRWVARWPLIYRSAFIVKQAFSSLVIMFTGQSPVAIALILTGIFLFGFVSRIAENVFLMVEALVSLTFGDSLYSLYDDFSDGSLTYNTISFVYVTLLIGVMIWVFFTSYTALMTSLDHQAMHTKEYMR